MSVTVTEAAQLLKQLTDCNPSAGMSREGLIWARESQLNILADALRAAEERAFREARDVAAEIAERWGEPHIQDDISEMEPRT